MANSLVIVESPAKAKTIGKYLGKNYLVKASLGHIKDLPKKDLAVDVDHGFEPTYVVIEGKKKLISELKQAAKKADAIYLAADPDREGEAICYHLKEELEGKRDGGPTVQRVMFNEITPNAIRRAFEKPSQVDMHLVEAQQARRVLDRLVGYKISPLLWDKVRRGLSAGRVQTVAVRLIVEREREVRAFQKREYWTIDVNLAAKKPPALTARFIRRNDEGIEIGDEAAAKSLIDQLADAHYAVKSVVTREKRRNPVPPFITSTLQQEASRKLRFSVKRAMGIAQRLYEGVALGKEGPTGLITYMRTDSTRVSDDALREARAFIGEKFGAQYVPESPNVYRSKKGAQDAHEAVRPTDVTRTPESLEKYLQEDELKLYRLIWMRFVASQMMPAVFDQTTIDVSAQGKDGAEYVFRATGSVPKFDGFLAVYEEGKDQKDEEDEELKHKLPAVVEGEALKFKAIVPEQHFTEPPPRFNEATLVKKLEADGVGRPSTYASIISTIQERGYVKKEGGKFLPTELGMVVTDLLVGSFEDIFQIRYTARMEEELKHKLPAVVEGEALKFKAIVPEQHFTEPPPRFNEATLVKKLEADGVGRPSTYASIISTIQERGYVKKEGGKFLPTELGMVVTDLLVESFEDIFQIRYTARMEEELDDIEEGKIDWRAAIGEFYEKFKGDLSHAEEHMTDIKRMEKPTDLVCDKCGKPMVIRWGKHGSFIGCSGYPDCTNTRELTVDLPDVDNADLSDGEGEEYCENCGRPMVLKRGRFGTFYACSGYPDCKTTRRIGEGERKADVPLDEKCPQCGNNLVMKYGRFGEFTACSNYPTCRYVKQKTIGVKCPDCGEGDIIERRSKRGKTFYGCNRYPECKFVAWSKPIAEKCPECGSPYLLEKWLKSGHFAQCPNPECKHKHDLAPVETATA